MSFRTPEGPPRSLLERVSAWFASGTGPDSGRALAAIPLGVALVLGPLFFPWGAPPDAIPLPVIDTRVLDAVVAKDEGRADRAEKEGLPDDVRTLGTALRHFNELEAKSLGGNAIHEARRTIDDAMLRSLRVEGPEKLLELRAFQLRTFLAEVRRYEETGVVSAELESVGGDFVGRTARTGWVKDHAIVFGEAERRVMFKLKWNASASLEQHESFVPTLDEMRTLYSFYLRHPHASDAARADIESARRGAKDAKACEAIRAGEEILTEGWRLDKVVRLAALDPTYPAAFAKGVVQYRRGNFAASAESFRDWLRDHPEGPYTARARNHLKAANDAARDSF
ncbi:MAG: hypothetical protein U0169_11190 [Polyangiaceae bacterium]